MKILIRIPGLGSDFPIEDITPDDTVEMLKKIIAEKHPRKPGPGSQRLISGGKLLQNEQKISDLNLTESSPIIHLVISELIPKVTTPEPTPTQPPAEVPTNTEESTNEVRNEPDTNDTSNTQETPSDQPRDSTDWLTPELKEYFAVWDLSIRCYELSDTHKYLAPKMKIYKSLIMANQKQRILGTGGLLSESANNGANNVDLPRQNVDRENAVVGAQGGVEDDGPQDWLDRFYTLFRLSLMLFIVYNYSSTERFFAVLAIAVSIMLYQGGFFHLQRRRRPNTPDQPDAGEGGVQREAERPGVFRMIWVFLSQFVASLIPQNPAPVNAN